MIERVEFNPTARQEVADSFDWYESREADLGNDFLGALDDCIILVRLHPEIAPIAFKNYRKALMKRFPFAVFYRVSSSILTIYEAARGNGASEIVSLRGVNLGERIKNPNENNTQKSQCRV